MLMVAFAEGANLIRRYYEAYIRIPKSHIIPTYWSVHINKKGFFKILDALVRQCFII